MSSFDTDHGVIILETAQWAVLQRMEDSNPVVAPNGPSSAIPLRPVLGTEVWAEVSRWLWANPSSTGSSRSTFAPLRPPGERGRGHHARRCGRCFSARPSSGAPLDGRTCSHCAYDRVSPP